MTRETVAVVGAGTMGRGIAQVCAFSGYFTTLIDADPHFLPQAIAAIQADLEAGVAKGRYSNEKATETLSKITTSTQLEKTADADWIIEAIPENIEQKIHLFLQIESFAKDTAIFASNTSSLSIAQIATATKRPDRLLGLHFFNPVPKMKLLEIIKWDQTKVELIEKAKRFAISLEKTPIVVCDSPGFATSRLGVTLGLEAIRMLEEGVASIVDIDRAMMLGYGHPMGPLQLCDLIGLDVRLAICSALHETLRTEAFRPPLLLAKMVDAQMFGKKAGCGFYLWQMDRCLGPNELLLQGF